MAFLEQLKKKILMMTAQPVPFDPSRFGDPIALRTEWTPAKGGGASFRTHKLVGVTPTRMEFRASVGGILFSLLFLLLGMGLFTAISWSWLKKGRSFLDTGLLIPLLLGLVFAAVGAYLLYFVTTPLVFEKGRGVFWKGRKGPDEAIDSRKTDRYVRLDQVHAVQLIAEQVRGNKSSYYSYELNLVLNDGKRITVVDHGNLNRIREDGRVLAMFLGKSLWDAT